MTRELRNRVEELEQREIQLGVPLLAIHERLRLIKPAYQSPHGHLTSELCREALQQIPSSLAEYWKNVAHTKWPWIFKPTRRNEPAPTLTPPTPTAEVSA
jgi:hypothetical protein